MNELPSDSTFTLAIPAPGRSCGPGPCMIVHPPSNIWPSPGSFRINVIVSRTVQSLAEVTYARATIGGPFGGTVIRNCRAKSPMGLQRPLHRRIDKQGAPRPWTRFVIRRPPSDPGGLLFQFGNALGSGIALAGVVPASTAPCDRPFRSRKEAARPLR